MPQQMPPLKKGICRNRECKKEWFIDERHFVDCAHNPQNGKGSFPPFTRDFRYVCPCGLQYHHREPITKEEFEEWKKKQATSQLRVVSGSSD